MSPRDELLELERALMQLPVELARGLAVLDGELRRGRFMQARATVAQLGVLPELHEATARRLIELRVELERG